MNTKTQELVTAGYALAKGLDVESAKLVKQLADELAVQRVRADELNKQVVNLAVESSELKQLIEQHANCFSVCLNCSHEEPSDTDDIVALYRSLKTPVTDAELANIRAIEAKEIYESILDNPAVTDLESLVDWLESYANNSISFASALRKGAAV